MSFVQVCKRLSCYLEGYEFGSDAFLSHPKQNDDWEIPYIISGIRNWMRFEHLIANQGIDIISEDEQKVYQLIKDWHEAIYQPHACMARYYHGLKLEAKSDFRFTEFMEEKRNHLPFLNSNQEWDNVSAFTETPIHKLYDGRLTTLFCSEFAGVDTYDRVRPTYDRFRDRCDCAVIACHQRISWRCYHDVLSLGCDDVLDHGIQLRACPWLDPREKKAGTLGGWPEYLWHIDEARLVCTEDLDAAHAHPPYMAISHTWGRWASQDGSGHMIPGGFSYPVPLNSTFDVKRLPDFLRELKANNNLAIDYVWLDLVCIPQGPDKALIEHDRALRAREISRQGPIFQNAARAIAWLHDMESFSVLEAIMELATLSTLSFDENQADTRLAHLMEREMLRISNNQTGLLKPLPPDHPLRTYRRKESIRSERYGPSSDLSLESPATSWFTSLWTLQEVCLRPDMWLAARDWKIMTLRNGYRIPFDYFSSICTLGHVVAPGKVAVSKKIRQQWGEVIQWHTCTGLLNVHSLGRIQILSLGDRRECSGRRSEAIMSAIGAVSWFSEAQNDNSGMEEDLILGKYTTGFIQEVRKLNQGEFFGILTKTPLMDAEDDNPIGSYVFHLTGVDGFSLLYTYDFASFNGLEEKLLSSFFKIPAGSLLPFSRTKATYCRYAGRDYADMPLIAHASLNSWSIEPGGRVRMTRACVLSSNMSPVVLADTEDLPVTFYGFRPSDLEESSVPYNSSTKYPLLDAGYNSTFGHISHMHAWVASRLFEVHLVVVRDAISREFPMTEDDCIDVNQSCKHLIWGIVLRGVALPDDPQDDSDRQVKIGLFLVEVIGNSPWSLPEERDVDWVVL